MNALDAEAIRAAMGGMEIQVRALREVDSTNLRLKEWAREGIIRAPYLLAADRQTAGRGRLGRAFVSPEGGLYMSLLAPMPEGAGPETVTILSAVAMCRAIEELTPLRPCIKWVNDLFVNGKKVCGILAERIGAGAVIGIGVNVQTPPGGYPPEAGAAGALDVPVDRNRLAGRAAELILEGLLDPREAETLDQYKKRMFLTGRVVAYRIGGREEKGLVTGVSSDGGLIVRDGEKETVLRSGEVTLGSQSAARLE